MLIPAIIYVLIGAGVSLAHIRDDTEAWEEAIRLIVISILWPSFIVTLVTEWLMRKAGR